MSIRDEILGGKDLPRASAISDLRRYLARLRASERRLPDWLRHALLIALVLTVIGLLHGTADLIFNDRKFPGFITRVMDAWSWALLVPLIIACDKYLPLSEKQFPLRIVAILLLSVPFVTAHVLIEASAEYPIKAIAWNPFRSQYETYYYFYGGWVSYCAIASALLAVRYYKQFSAGRLQLLQLEKRLLQAHLHILRMQLEPHFVGNALNAISNEVDMNPPRARKLIEDLGVLLRLSHEYKDRQLIPLADEIALLDHYLAIQRVRFRERLRIDIRIATEVKFTPVPCLLIQPLVENAIRHGLEKTALGGTISISAERAGSSVEIRLTDNGAGLPPGWQLETSTGQGLTITRERLAALYPQGAGRITIGPRQGGGTEVLVSIPIQATGQNP